MKIINSTLKTIIVMGIALLGSCVIYLSCADSDPITCNPGEKQIPLIEGKQYYAEQSGIRSILLGEYHLINGEVTFTDTLTCNVFTIKLIQ